MSNSQIPQDNNTPRISIVGPIIGIIIAAIGIAAAIIIVIFWKEPEPEVSVTSTPEPTITVTSTPTPDIVTSDGILRRIETTSRLQTTIYRIDTVVRAKGEDSWINPFDGQKLILFVQGSVTAGIDLSELREDDIEISQDNHTIVITLPEAKILEAKIDSYEVETYEGEKPEDVELNLLQEALKAGQQQVEEIACTDKILDRATTDSKNIFEDMMELIEVEGFEIIVESSSVSSCSFEVKL